MDNMKSDKFWKYLKALLIVYAFYSLHCWPFFNVNDMNMKLAFIGLLLPCLNRPYWNTSAKRIHIIIVLEILLLYVAGLGNFNRYLFAIVGSVPLISLILLKEEYLKDLFETFQKVLAPILGLGALFWIAHLFGYDLPYQNISFGVRETSQGDLVDQYTFQNHYLYLVNISWMMDINANIPSYFRFSSIFLEPGYTAVLVMYLLYLNHFEFKYRRNQVYLLTLLLTLSLAGFILTLFAFIAHKLQNSSKRVTTLVGIGLLLTFGYIFFTNYNGGHNAINETIIERLQYDEENRFVGNNRTSEAMDAQFDAFLVSPDIIFGLRDKNLLEFGVGYKAYLLMNGIIGMILFIVYLLQIAKLKGNFRSYVLMTLYLLMFARGHSSMFWAAVTLIYMAGVMKSDEVKISKDLHT